MHRINLLFLEERCHFNVYAHKKNESTGLMPLNLGP